MLTSNHFVSLPGVIAGFASDCYRQGRVVPVIPRHQCSCQQHWQNHRLWHPAVRVDSDHTTVCGIGVLVFTKRRSELMLAHAGLGACRVPSHGYQTGYFPAAHRSRGEGAVLMPDRQLGYPWPLRPVLPPHCPGRTRPER